MIKLQSMLRTCVLDYEQEGTDVVCDCEHILVFSTTAIIYIFMRVGIPRSSHALKIITSLCNHLKIWDLGK